MSRSASGGQVLIVSTQRYIYEKYTIEENNMNNSHINGAIQRGVDSNVLNLPKGASGKVKVTPTGKAQSNGNSDKEVSRFIPTTTQAHLGRKNMPKKTTARSKALATATAKKEKVVGLTFLFFNLSSYLYDLQDAASKKKAAQPKPKPQAKPAAKASKTKSSTTTKAKAAPKKSVKKAPVTVAKVLSLILPL